MPPVIAPGTSRCVGTVFGVSTRKAPMYMPMFTSAATTSASTARMAAFCPYVFRLASSVVTITAEPRKEGSSRRERLRRDDQRVHNPPRDDQAHDQQPTSEPRHESGPGRPGQ